MCRQSAIFCKSEKNFSLNHVWYFFPLTLLALSGKNFNRNRTTAQGREGRGCDLLWCREHHTETQQSKWLGIHNRIMLFSELFILYSYDSYDTFHYHKKQCCGSMTFLGGSGSADPCLWLMDPDPDSDPDPSIFVIDLQDASKKQIFITIFSAYDFLKLDLHNF
jgi:hypothetical protein